MLEVTISNGQLLNDDVGRFTVSAPMVWSSELHEGQ